MRLGLSPQCCDSVPQRSPSTSDSPPFRRLWDGYNLTNCISDIKNGPWSGQPWNTTDTATLGIRNLIGGPCDWDGRNNTTLRFFTRKAGLSKTTDPIAPGVKTAAVSAALHWIRSSRVLLGRGGGGGDFHSSAVDICVIVLHLHRPFPKLLAG